MSPAGVPERITGKKPKTSRDEATHKPAAEDQPAPTKSNDITASEITGSVRNNPGTLATQYATGEAGSKQTQNDFGNDENNPATQKNAKAGLEPAPKELPGSNSSSSRATEDGSPDQGWSSAAELRAALVSLTEAILANRGAGNVNNNPATVTAEETTALNKRTEKFRTANTKAAGAGHFDEAVRQLNESQAFGRQLAQAAKDAAKAHSESAGVILQALADLRASNQKLQEQIYTLQATGNK